MYFLFYICLVVAIDSTYLNVGSLFTNQDVSWFQILVMSLSLGGVITFCMNLW